MGNCADGANNCASWVKSSPDTFSNCESTNYDGTQVSYDTSGASTINFNDPEI